MEVPKYTIYVYPGTSMFIYMNMEVPIYRHVHIYAEYGLGQKRQYIYIKRGLVTA